jgi:hypothetical protein
MRDTMAKALDALDGFGRLTDPWPKDYKGYNFRDMRNYCKRTGKDMRDLTEREVESFRITN